MKETNSGSRRWAFEDFASDPELTGRDWLRVSVALAFWTFLVLVGTSTAFIAMQGERLELWLATFVPMSKYYVVWAVVAPVIYHIVHFGTGSVRRVLLSVACHALLLAAVSAVEVVLIAPASWREWLAGGAGTAFLALGVTIYVMLVFASLALRFYRRSLNRERAARNILLAAKSVENDLNLARLDLVSLQLRPHFLFNALNGITALIEKGERESATEMVYRLGHLLRTMLVRLRADETTLGEEIEFVADYVALQRLRAPGGIELCVEIADELLHASVPPMILQPLVENAIRFSIGDGQRGAAIRIAADANGRLRITVRDNGVAASRETPGDSAGTGYGLASVRQRLDIYYGEEASLSIDTAEGSGATVTLELPYEAPPQALAAGAGNLAGTAKET